MKRHSDTQVEESILQLDYQIKQLQKHIDNCETSNKLYNRLLVERAVKRSQLNNKKSLNLISWFQKKLKLTPKKRICDYF